MDDPVLADTPMFANVLEVGEPLSFPGFPDWHEHNGDRPILRTGTIVSDRRQGHRMNSGPTVKGDGNQQLAFEAFLTKRQLRQPGVVQWRRV